MLKMPTGFDASHVKATLSHPQHAGLEQTRTCQCQDSRPYCLPFSTRVQVLKSPFFATEAWFPAWLTPPATPLSNVIVPIRPATETSRSRAELAMKNSRGSFWGGAHSVLEQQQFDDHVLSRLSFYRTRGMSSMRTIVPTSCPFSELGMASAIANLCKRIAP